MDRVGFIGLGNLGLPMALTLLRDGFALSVFDPVAERVEKCVEAGALAAPSSTELADCGTVALAVPDDDAVTGLLVGEQGLLSVLAPGSVVLLHSTVLPRTATRLHELGVARGVEVVDAPVSGGAQRAADGDLTIMVGGDPGAVRAVDPLLRSVGSTVTHVGPTGAGAAVKLANQLMMFSALAGAQEGLELAATFGVEERDVLSAVSTSLGDSWVVRNWGFFDEMANSYDEGGTPVRERSWSKDLWDVVVSARDMDLQLPLAGLLSQILASKVESHAAKARRGSGD